jgi:hypothetical protein
MGDTEGKQMIFVKMEPEYKQEGWLNLIMGRSLWIDATQPDALPLVIKRVSQTASVAPKQNDSAAGDESSKPSSPVSTASSSDVNAIQTMLSTLSAQFEDMRAEIKAIRADVSALQAEVKSIKQ